MKKPSPIFNRLIRWLRHETTQVAKLRVVKIYTKLDCIHGDTSAITTDEISDALILWVLAMGQYAVASELLQRKPDPIKRPSWWYRFRQRRALHPTAIHDYDKIFSLITRHYDALDLPFSVLTRLFNGNDAFLIGQAVALLRYPSADEGDEETTTLELNPS